MLYSPLSASRRAPFVPLNISKLGHVLGSKMLTLVVTLGAVFSVCVGPIRMPSFVPIRNRVCTIYGKKISQKKSTHNEILTCSRSGKYRKYLYVLTFFDRRFFPFWDTPMGARGEKTSSENIPHTARNQPLGLRLGLAFTGQKIEVIRKCFI